MDVDYNDMDQEIYENELKNFLPKKIFDSHVHIFDDSNFYAGHVIPKNYCQQKFGGIFPMELYNAYCKKILPDHELFCNHFGMPCMEANRDAASHYTSVVSDNKHFFGMALVSPKDSIEDIKTRIESNNLVGYKPYLNFVDWKDKSDITINDMLPVEQMKYANEKGLIVTLHIPRPGRLADPVNQQQMLDICDNYPNAKIIFAHIGRAYYMKNVVGYLDELGKRPNAWLDTAMVNHEGVLEYTFNHFPRKRILFGSDAPIAFLRGKSVEINNQYAYLMGEQFAIGNTIYDANNVVEFTTFFYEQLRGVKRAAESAKLSQGEVDDFFFNNAMELFKRGDK